MSGAADADPPIITGTIWMCSCGRERKRPVVPAGHYNALASLIRQVSDEVVLVPVSTLNAISERAERAERALEDHLAERPSCARVMPRYD